MLAPKEIDRNDLQIELQEKKIPTMIYYRKPMHLQKAFKGTYSSIADCPVTEQLCNTVLSLPIGPYMTKEEVEYVVESLKIFMDVN